jgi:hypothetical protein
MKRIFLEGNPYLLALTMAVSMLHSVFDFLAFKNDIGFWKENKSMEGLSARSIVINAFCQLVGCGLLQDSVLGCVCEILVLLLQQQRCLLLYRLISQQFLLWLGASG